MERCCRKEGLPFVFVKQCHLVQWLDTPVSVQGWTAAPKNTVDDSFQRRDETRLPVAASGLATPVHNHRRAPASPAARELAAALHRACRCVIDAEPTVTDLDRRAGDGDCGQTLQRGAEALLLAATTNSLDFNQPSQLLADMARVLATAMGGSSGALYSILLTRGMQTARTLEDSAKMPLAQWGEVLHAGE